MARSVECTSNPCSTSMPPYSAFCTPRGAPFTDGLPGITGTCPAAVTPDISGRALAASVTSTTSTSRIRKSEAYGFVDAIWAEAGAAHISIGMTTDSVRMKGEIFAMGETRYTRSRARDVKKRQKDEVVLS